MKWFNYNSHPYTSIKTRQGRDSFCKKIGKWFMVTCKSGNKHRAKYCQISFGEYRFISDAGNRIVDDNTEIKATKEI